jgi:tetratricopeptide (TPR) repeat protein
MKHHRLFALLFSAATALFLSSSLAQAYTSSDYYNAGLQLYNAQNYSQAVQYFSAAIQVDPNNAAALQGRANCYYAQGQYQQALDDYQKVQVLQPNPQLAAMIQSLQAKLGTAPSAAPPAPGPAAASPSAVAPPPAPGAATPDSFAQGTALYQQRQYAQAIPLFQQAVRDNPKNANAYYYLGVCQMQAGDMKDAAVALGVSNKLNPNPSVASYVDQLKARLSPGDQQWVDGQITAEATTAAAGISAPTVSKSFGIRLEPALYLVSLSDFTASAQTDQKLAQQDQANDPSLTFNGSVPSGFLGIGVEPVLKLGDDLELGLDLAVLPVGTVTLNTQDSNGNVTNSSLAIAGVDIGLNLRYFLGKGDLQPFIAGGPLVCPIGIALSGTNASAGVTATGSGNFSGLAVGGQVQAGLDYHLGDTFLVNLTAGFQLASASSFTGSVSVNGSNGSGTEPGQLEFSTTGQEIYFLPSGQSPATGDRPLQVDLSGPYVGLGVSAYF